MTPAQNFAGCLLVIGAGVSLALQQVVNANLRAEIDSPWWAGFASYFGGMVVMLVVALAVEGPSLSGPVVARTSWPSWTGGLLGAIYIATAIFMVPRLGAANVVALIVVGQMLGSVTFDHLGLLGIARRPVNPMRLAGAAFLILGVILVRI